MPRPEDHSQPSKQHAEADSGVWCLNAEQSKAFAEALSALPEPKAALKAAAKRYRALVFRSA